MEDITWTCKYMVNHLDIGRWIHQILRVSVLGMFWVLRFSEIHSLAGCKVSFRSVFSGVSSLSHLRISRVIQLRTPLIHQLQEGSRGFESKPADRIVWDF